MQLQCLLYILFTKFSPKYIFLVLLLYWLVPLTGILMYFRILWLDRHILLNQMAAFVVSFCF